MRKSIIITMDGYFSTDGPLVSSSYEFPIVTTDSGIELDYDSDYLSEKIYEIFDTLVLGV